MAFNPDAPFLPQFLPIALDTAKRFVNTPSKIPSTTIREYLETSTVSNTSGVVRVPVYWASWYHDGRGTVSAKNKTFLVYYLNPQDDPRLSGGRPVTPDQVVSLSKFPGRLKKDLKSGKAIMTRSVGPTRVNYPYFDDQSANGMLGLQGKLDDKANESLDEFVRASLRTKGLLSKKVKVTV